MPPVQPYLIVPPIVAFAVFFTLACFVFFRDRHKTMYRLFALFLVGMGLWGLVIFALRVSPDAQHAKVWAQVVAPMGVMTGAAFLHFAYLYTRARIRVWALFIIYGIFVAVVIMDAAGLLVEDITYDKWGVLPVYSSLNEIIGVVSYTLLVLGIMRFIRAYRKSEFFEERNSYLYILVGLGLSMAGGIWDYLSVVISVAPLGLIGNILFGVLATIAILRYHLLDIRIMARRSVAYILTSTIVAVPYVGILVLMNIVFQQNLPLWGHMVLLLALALGLQALWQKVQNLVDRWFYREAYDFLRELERFSQEPHDISNLNELGSSLVNLVNRAFQATNVHLLIANESGSYRTISSTGIRTQQMMFQRRSPLVQWLANNRGILERQQLELNPVLQSIAYREKAEIDATGARLFVSLKTNTGEMVGILVMGTKRSEQPYSEEDLRRIMTVTSRIAVEIESARSYAKETAMRLELQELDSQKTEFLHHVAHELKTPLTAIISSSELMTADDITAIPPEQRERLLNNINRSAWLMDKKVGELLDLARIQIGRVELHFERLDISEIVEDISSQVLSLFRNKEQSVEVKIPDSLPPIRGDRDRIEEVLLNLLSNANKFSPAGGHITIIASESDSEVMVEVKDSSPIISEIDRARIFDPYYRGGTEEDKQRVSGLGLGLAICKSLIEMHGGEIGVTAEEGRGNTFYFTVPVWKEEEDEEEDDAKLAVNGKQGG